jgi:glycosyltransferase involved in cell wall biosynthesis
VTRPRISCFLPSFNKHGFAVEAVQSVLDQDTGNWELFILENSTDRQTRVLLKELPVTEDPRIRYDELDDLDEIRNSRYITSWLLNQHYPRAQGDFIFYLSDDDLLHPAIFGEIAKHFDENLDHDALYFSLARSPAGLPGEGTDFGSSVWPPIIASVSRGPSQVDCQIDGGQVCYRKEVLTRMEQPWFPEDARGDTACHSDGLFLDKLAHLATFHPLPVYGVKHRMTPLSTWTRH